ncbi:unnamed protein product [Phytomonas sp. Hart1]|nr:unnamed protein product [Phytomonas sp. Hart1]|eukprot:CCW66603.1 unnamed protein product [Phytomonas sp. isolate Hart1]
MFRWIQNIVWGTEDGAGPDRDELELGHHTHYELAKLNQDLDANRKEITRCQTELARTRAMIVRLLEETEAILIESYDSLLQNRGNLEVSGERDDGCETAESRFMCSLDDEPLEKERYEVRQQANMYMETLYNVADELSNRIFILEMQVLCQKAERDSLILQLQGNNMELEPMPPEDQPPSSIVIDTREKWNASL